jgi:hypothetical protein
LQLTPRSRSQLPTPVVQLEAHVQAKAATVEMAVKVVKVVLVVVAVKVVLVMAVKVVLVMAVKVVLVMAVKVVLVKVVLVKVVLVKVVLVMAVKVVLVMAAIRASNKAKATTVLAIPLHRTIKLNNAIQ